VVLAIQEAQLAEHGGLPGIRDQELLESALARPKNLFAYSPEATLKQFAAAYAVGIGKNHAFLDGNKRTAWFVCAVFLELNGISVDRDQLDVVRLMREIANSSMTEEEVAAWLEQD
jgi:death-on-curing protein